MVFLFNKNLLIFILIPIASVTASFKRQTKPDKICGETRSVLCVNSVLIPIGTTTKIIERLANDIEIHILNKTGISSTVNELVKKEMDLIRTHLPEFKYHEKFRDLNNFDKEFLGHLLKEGHYSMSYYYNSIDDILEMNDLFGFTTDSEFRIIQDYLSTDIICQYRNMLAVYSLEWPLTNQVSRIQLSRNMYGQTRSVIRDVHSLIVTKLLQNWMERIRYVVDNLGKYY